MFSYFWINKKFIVVPFFLFRHSDKTIPTFSRWHNIIFPHIRHLPFAFQFTLYFFALFSLFFFLFLFLSFSLSLSLSLSLYLFACAFICIHPYKISLFIPPGENIVIFLFNLSQSSSARWLIFYMCIGMWNPWIMIVFVRSRQKYFICRR